MDEGQAGDNAGLLLRGLKREEIERGQVIVKPGSVSSHTKFECKTVILGEDEGGRKKPFKSGYRPQFYFHATDVTEFSLTCWVTARWFFLAIWMSTWKSN